MKWLITGGCGFIGTSLVAEIQAMDPQAGIRVLDDLSVGSLRNLSAVAEFRRIEEKTIETIPQGVELVVGDVRKPELVDRCCFGIEAIAHLAGQTGVAYSLSDPYGDMDVNIGGTIHLLEGAREHGVKRFILASSNAAAGEVELPIKEASNPKPISPYGASKLSCEAYCHAYSHTYGIKAVSLRFSNVYGPGSAHKNSVISRFIVRALEGDPLEIFGDGKQTRDFLYIKDLTRAIILSAEKGPGGEVFQIASARETSINTVCQKIQHLVVEAGFKRPEILSLPKRRSDLFRNYSDNSKAEKILSWRPEVSLDQGLGETLTYFLSLRR